MVYHATPAVNLASIRECGLLVAKVPPTSKIKGVWVCTANNRAWAVLHTLQKYHISLEEVVVIEVMVALKSLTAFGRGFYYSTTDIAPSKLGIVINGLAFGAGVSD